MAKQRPAWVNDVLLFAGVALFNLVLIVPCGLILKLSDSPKRGFGVSDLWYWVFATPMILVKELGWNELAGLLFWLNPIIYGLVWRGAWRVFKLSRTRPVD